LFAAHFLKSPVKLNSLQGKGDSQFGKNWFEKPDIFKGNKTANVKSAEENPIPY
jgi:hypothetical protein